MIWTETYKSLGVIPEGKKMNMVYKMVSSSKTVKRTPDGKGFLITASCGCTVAAFNEKSGTLNVEYVPSKVPVHLVQAGQNRYTTTKYITVKYTDDTEDKLSFSATVTT